MNPFVVVLLPFLICGDMQGNATDKGARNISIGDFDGDNHDDVLEVGWRIRRGAFESLSGSEPRAIVDSKVEVSVLLRSMRPNSPTILWEADFAILKNDLLEMLERCGLEADPKLPIEGLVQLYLNAWGPTGGAQCPFGVIDQRQIESEELGAENIQRVINFKKSKVGFSGVRQELLQKARPVLTFYGHWAEDINQIVYSPSLDFGIYLLSQYER